MRTIRLPKTETFPARDVLRAVAEKAGPGGIGVAEMRQRLRILDAIDVAGFELTLEDADHALLARLAEAFPFAVAHRDLVAIVDAIRPEALPAEVGGRRVSA